MGNKVNVGIICGFIHACILGNSNDVTRDRKTTQISWFVNMD